MDDVEKNLEAQNIRPTAMRILIYKFMARMNRAITLTEIENNFGKANRTTISRTMRTFEAGEIVHQIDDGTGIPKYALCESDCHCEVEQDLHIHFHCNHCNETVCLTDHKIPSINLPQGYLAEDINLVVKGVCHKCNGFKNSLGNK